MNGRTYQYVRPKDFEVWYDDTRLGWMAREINTHDIVRVKTLFSIDIGEGISYSSDDYPWSC